MDSQKFCLKWNNFQNSVTSVFETLRKDEELVDITLCCEGHKIKAHRMMLSACSPFFRDLFKENPCQHPVFFLKDTSYPDLAAVVEFVYKGEVNVAQSQLGSFLKTAEMLQVRGLTGDDEEEATQQRLQTQRPEPRAPARGVITTPVPHGGRATPADHSGGARTPLPAAQVRSRPPPPEQRPSSPPGKRRRLSEDVAPLPTDGAASSGPATPSQAPAEGAAPASPALDHRGPHNSSEGADPLPVSLSDTLSRTPHLPPPSPQQQQQYPPAELPPPQQQDYSNVKVEKVDLVDDDDESLEATFNQVSTFEASQFEGSDHSASSQDMAGLLSQGMGGDLSAMAGPSEDGSAQGGGAYWCELCGARFKTSSRMSEHRAVHLGRTTCPVCQRVFTRRTQMKNHLSTIHHVDDWPEMPRRHSRKAGDQTDAGLG